MPGSQIRQGVVCLLRCILSLLAIITSCDALLRLNTKCAKSHGFVCRGGLLDGASTLYELPSIVRKQVDAFVTYVRKDSQ